MMTEAPCVKFGLTDEELLALPTVYREGLFANQIVLVSGAGSGLGRGIACLFGRLGAHAVLCGRTREKLEGTARLLQRVGARCLVVPMTIREPAQVSALFEHVYEECGRLDVLVNNAGGQFAQPSIEISPRGWNAVIDTNLSGTWYMMQRAAQMWCAHGTPGCIVNIVAPFIRGMYGVAHTVAARAGVTYLVRNVAVEWSAYRIRVNCVLPGPINTEGMNAYSPEARASLARSNPMLRLGDVQDIAEACAYLAAPSGKFITGEVITVDGGLQLWGELWLAGKPPGSSPAV